MPLALVEATRYRALVRDAVWRSWGDELAVYEGRSARTHLLADGHAELFGLLAARDEPVTLNDIAHEFAGGDTAPAAALSHAELQSLQALVGELVDLGLVETIVD
jgi:hypothetical protein